MFDSIYQFNRHYQKNAKIDFFEDLQTENASILSEIKRLEKCTTDTKAISTISLLKEKFMNFAGHCSSFNSSLSTNLNESRQQAQSFKRSIQSQRSFSSQLDKKKNRIKSQEVELNLSEKRWQRSLGMICGMWEKNLNEMETSIKSQKETIKRIGTQHLSTIRCIEKEMQEAIDGPKVPNLQLERIQKAKITSKPSSARSSSSLRLTEDEDLISNRSAFSYITNDVASHRSNSSRPHLPQVKRGNPPLPPSFPSPSINISYVSEINESFEFDKLMLEIAKDLPNKENPNSISMEKTIGGWKSEYESEGESMSLQLNPDEIKKALMVLKKAKLLSPGGNQILLKMAEMLKDKNSSSNVELMLQLINIERNKVKASPKMSSRLRSHGKPPTPTHAGQRKRKAPSDFVGTARDKFMFSEEKSFDKTILSNENHLSPKGSDMLCELFTGRGPNEVKLEDLLNVSSYVDSLGLISADTSVIHEEYEKNPGGNKGNQEDNKKKINEYRQEDFPVRLRKERDNFKGNSIK